MAAFLYLRFVDHFQRHGTIIVEKHIRNFRILLVVPQVTVMGKLASEEAIVPLSLMNAFPYSKKKYIVGGI